MPSLIQNNIIKSDDNVSIRQFRKLTIKENVQKVKELLPFLGEWRAESYKEWLTEVGYALYNLTDGSREGVELWMQFSQKCPDKYNEATCIYEWKKNGKS